MSSSSLILNINILTITARYCSFLLLLAAYFCWFLWIWSLNFFTKHLFIFFNYSFQTSSISKDDSYTLVVFNISVLAEIATYKSSISGAWKVEPSTFDLLTRILDPTNKIMAVQFPGVQHSILTTLYTHSQRCNNFVPGPKSKSSGNCKDSNHLIKVLCSILSEPSSSTSAKYLTFLLIFHVIYSW